MPASIKPLSDLDLSGTDGRRLNVCVVSSEFLGPVKNGGIATATSGLLRQLASEGHRVTLLYTLVEYQKPWSGDHSWDHWVAEQKAAGVMLAHIPHAGDYRGWLEKSWLVKEFLGRDEFDVVYFNDHHGNGYYTLAAKRAGLAPFTTQLHCLITHGSIEWVCDINEQYGRSTADVEMMGLERRGVEWADVVIGPSAYLLKKYESYGWKLPTHTYTHPYALFHDPTPADPTHRHAIRELVFFGRLEVRKGLWLFCEALDHLGDRLRGIDITFLGRMTDTAGLSSGIQIAARAMRWPNRVRMLTNYNQENALAYLKSGSKLAVMPSLADNSPCVLYECMEGGIPFISTRGSGGDELVHPDCWRDMMVEPTVQALADALGRALAGGAQVGRPRFDPQQNLATWAAWHRRISRDRTEFFATPVANGNTAAAVNTAQQQRIPLIAIIDRGTAPFGVVVDNLATLIGRFGNRAAYLVLSSRRDLLREALLSMFVSPDTASAVMVVINEDDLEEAREVIIGSACTFFVDADTELLTPFFMLALDVIAQSPAAVSCAVATRSSASDVMKLEELPGGDIPGLSGLGWPIGGGVCAISASALADHVLKVDFYDKRSGMLTPARLICEALLHICRSTGTPVHVLPMVGAVATSQPDRPRPSASYDAIEEAAHALDIAPTVHGGGAPWFAISAYGAHGDQPAEVEVEGSSMLPPDHPLTACLSDKDKNSPAELAAAIGRPELALQMEAASGPSAERVRQLIEISTRAKRERPVVDLIQPLAARVMEFGRTATPQEYRGDQRADVRSAGDRGASAVHPSAGAESTSGPPIRVAFDARRLKLIRNKIQPPVKAEGHWPGRVFFFDVPLLGSSALTGRIRSVSTKETSLRVVVLDQSTGAVIGDVSIVAEAKSVTALSVPLHEVFSRAAVMIEFPTIDRLDVTIESLQVH